MKSNSKRRPITIVAGGCLVILYLALCAIVIFFGRIQLTEQKLPTPTVTPTVVPHVLVHVPKDPKGILHEDFSSNQRNWGLYFQFGKLEVINEKLILQSNIQDGIVLGTSEGIAPHSERYYVQADFSTDVEAPASYGLIFGLNRSLATYYLFDIWPQAGGFRFYKYNSGKWTELVPFSRAELRPYPQANTLSVYFDKGKIELYVNGTWVSEHSDKDYFRSKDVGIYVANAGYRLLVDDFFVFDETTD